MKKSISLSDFVTLASGLGIAYFVFLCVLHFSSGRVFWLDENFILQNLKALKGQALFGPLYNSQAFPRAYLYCLQKIGESSGFGVYSLRLLPFLFMLAAFFTWIAVYIRQGSRGIILFLLIFSWCGSSFMSYYASELKQYSMDVLAAGLFILFLIKQKAWLENDESKPRIIAAHILLPALILFSYTAYFFLPLPLYNLLLGTRKGRRNLLCLLAYAVSSAMFILLSFLLDLRFTSGQGGLSGYWNDYFISTASVYDFFKSFSEGLRNLFVRWFLEKKQIMHMMTLFMPCALYFSLRQGFKQIKGDKGLLVSLDSIGLVMLVILFFAGLLKIYPFTGARVTLFMAGFIFYAIVKGIEIFRKRAYVVFLALSSLYIIILLVVSINLAKRYLLVL